MNDCIKLILILIVVLVVFTFVTGAHKGNEHFETRECGKKYSNPGPGQCPSECKNMILVNSMERKCNNDGKNCKDVPVPKWVCKK